MTSADRFADLTLDVAPQPDATGHADAEHQIGEVSVVEDANEGLWPRESGQRCGA